MNDSIYPVASIIIPVYNVAPYLCVCIDSALAQTLPGIEIILVDDGSTDACPAICDNYAMQHPCIRVIHKTNGGLSDARNAGFSAARGKYVYFLDSDDAILPDAMETLYRIAQSNDAQAVLFEASVINEQGRPIFDPVYSNFYPRVCAYPGVWTGPRLFAEMLANQDYYSPVPMLFIRRDAMTIQFEPILHEDELFTPTLLYSLKRVCCCMQPFYLVRIRAGSITRVKKGAGHACGCCRVVEGLLDVPNRDTALNRRIMEMVEASVAVYSDLSAADKRRTRPSYKAMLRALRRCRPDGTQYATFLCRFRAFYPLMLRCIHALPDAAKNAIAARLFHRLPATLPALPHTNAPRIFLIGTPVHGNLGDHAIAQAAIQYFSDNFQAYSVCEITMPTYLRCRKALAAQTRPDDLIAVSGGGWLGNVWYHDERTVLDVVRRFSRNPIVILPQTVYYADTPKRAMQMQLAKKTYSSHARLLLCLREQYSFSLAKQLCPHVLQVPDLCLYLEKTRPMQQRTDVLFCIRQDREKVLDDNVVRLLEDLLIARNIPFYHTTTVLTRKISPALRPAALEKKFDAFCRARVVITDRLHAALFSAVTGTPCIAFDNLTRKVSGVCSELTFLPSICIVDNIDSAKDALLRFLAEEAPSDYRRPSYHELTVALEELLYPQSKI